MSTWPEEPAADAPDEHYYRSVYDEDADERGGRWSYEAHGRDLDFGLLLLRLACLPLVLHGVHKALNLAAFTREVDSNFIGSQAPEFIAWMIIIGQVALPVLIAVGLFTRPAAFLVALLVAVLWCLQVFLRLDYTVLSDAGVLTGEPLLLYLGLTLPLVFAGAGRWSVDMMRTGGRP